MSTETPTPDLSKVTQQAKSLWDGLSLKHKAAVLAVFGALAVGVVSTMQYEPEPDYAVLFSDLSVEDGASVSERLRADKVPFRLRPGGRVIEVPKDRVDELRLTLSAEGVARGGVGFELFDKQNFGTSSFVERLNHQRALAGELSRTIGSLEAVRSARVHLALPARSLFRQEDVPPSASVAVQLEAGRTLSGGQIKGIVRLVGASVPKLSRDHIAVVDEAGGVLWSGDEDELASGTQRTIEKTLRKRVQDLLDRIVGRDQSVVVVTAVMERGEEELTEERYDAAKPVLRSQTASEERRPARVVRRGGVVGAQANLPAAGAVKAPEKAEAGNAEYSTRRSETKNFEVSRIVRREQSARVRLGKLHIAILINDPSRTSTGTTATATTVDGLMAPKAADLDRVAALAREAAGLDPERGDRLEIHAMPFAANKLGVESGETKEAAVPEPPVWEKYMLPGIAGALLVIIGLLGFIVWRRRKKAEAEPDEEEANVTLPISASELEELLGGEEGDTTPNLEELKNRIRDAARKDSALAARILSLWILKNPAGETA